MHDNHMHEDEEEGQPLLGGGRGVQPASASNGPAGNQQRRTCAQSMMDAGRKLKLEVMALYLALGDPECGWKARTMVTVVLCYALSPLDWIPELIPALALLVDFIVLPLLIWACVKLMPPEVLERARVKAATHSLTMSGDWKLVLLVYTLWVMNVVIMIRIIGKHSGSHTYVHNHQLKLMAIGALATSLLFALLTWWRVSVEQRENKELVTGSTVRSEHQRLLDSEA